jgi:hypothetical protein
MLYKLFHADQLFEESTRGGLLPVLLLPVLLLFTPAAFPTDRPSRLWQGHTVAYYQE